MDRSSPLLDFAMNRFGSDTQMFEPIALGHLCRGNRFP
jgi:hypothetical protein